MRTAGGRAGSCCRRGHVAGEGLAGAEQFRLASPRLRPRGSGRSHRRESSPSRPINRTAARCSSGSRPSARSNRDKAASVAGSTRGRAGFAVGSGRRNGLSRCSCRMVSSQTRSASLVPRLKPAGDRLAQRILDEIVGLIRIARQRDGIAAQTRGFFAKDRADIGHPNLSKPCRTLSPGPMRGGDYRSLVTR